MTPRSHRIHRGFHRTGIVIALIVAALVSLVLFKDGVDVQYWKLQFGVALGVPIGVYVFSRAIGWIIAGFVGE